MFKIKMNKSLKFGSGGADRRQTSKISVQITYQYICQMCREMAKTWGWVGRRSQMYSTGAKTVARPV